MDPFIGSIVDGLGHHFYRTVTIFTESGGLSGSGFTGTLIFADCNVVKLLTCLGAAPCCPIGSDCDCGCNGNGGYNGYYNGYNGYNNGYNGYNNGYNGFGRFGNGLGSIVTIPTCAIAAFTHNTM